MKKAVITLLILSLLTFTACEIVGGIFKAGVWTGIIFVVLIIALIFYLITRMGNKK
jgi:hypothetical protein